MLLTAGNINDIAVARAWLQVRRLIADRGYDANHLRRLLAELHQVAYKDRNRIERMWCRLKDWHRIATRYDKLGRNYLSGAYLAAVLACWPN